MFYSFRKKICYFCDNKKNYVDYKDIDLLKKFVSKNANILPRRVLGTCAKHQRKVAQAIKRARIVSLLKFVEV